MNDVGHPFLRGLLARRSPLAPTAPTAPTTPTAPSVSWLLALRAEALERGSTLAVPTTRDEDWRFTDLAPLTRTGFGPVTAAPSLGADALAPFHIPEAGARLVFVDGCFSAPLSVIAAPGGGLFAGSLAAAFDTHDELLHTHLTRLADFRDDAFMAVNTAHLHDGALIVADAGHAVPQPVHLLHISTLADVAIHPRLLVVAYRDSDLTVIEDHVSLHHGACLSNAVSEIAVAAGARVRHVKLQRAGKAAFHVATTATHVERDARYHAVGIALGARLSRENVHVVQAGTGTDCQLDGLALIGGRQIADTHSFVDHALPDGTSRQLHKCIAAGAAHAVFNGRVLVREGAQRTNSAQQCRSLLLSGKAHIDAKPQLEIFADDVKCSHGAAIGQLEADEVFYLRTRGLDEVAARNILTYAFAAEIAGRIPVRSVVERLRAEVLQQTGAREIA